MRFGTFMAPFHPVGQNPTLAIERDLDLIVSTSTGWGFDEAWVGEHHSAGYEIIASPEVFLGVAAERTKHIKLGTGVSSLPYHHPLMLADRMVLLDHLTRGRTMLGVGPGQLTSDAHMLGIPADKQRPRMEEALDVMMALLRGETVTYECEWFTVRDARLQLAPVLATRASTSRSRRRSPRPARAPRASTASACSRSRRPRSRAWTCSAHHWDLWEELGAESGHVADRSQVAPRRPDAPRRDARAGRAGGRVRHRAVLAVLHPRAARPVRCRATPPPRSSRTTRPPGSRSSARPTTRSRKHRGADRGEQRRLRRVPALRPRLGDTRRRSCAPYELFAQYVMPQLHRASSSRPAASCDWVTGSGGEFVGRAANAIAKAIEDHAAERAAVTAD